jgi:signal peptidase I
MPSTIRVYSGSSMLGTFQPGDRLIIEPVPFTAVRPGDVVAFYPSTGNNEDVPIVHRVVAVEPTGLLTRGDNKSMIDREPVTADRLVGKVAYVERSGRGSVHGGHAGQLWVKYLRGRFLVRNMVAKLGGRLYGYLRASDLIRTVWRPKIIQMWLVSNHKVQVKYVCGRRTVARWWPHEQRFECRKPYDLVISRPDDIK